MYKARRLFYLPPLPLRTVACGKNPFLKIQQSNKISILETVELVRESAHVYPRVFERKLEVKSAALFQRRF